MNYKKILKEGEKVIVVTRIHAYVLIYPAVFTGVFGVVFTFGGILTGEFVEICMIMSAVLGIYPVTIALLILNSRFVITDRRVIEQTGVLARRQRSIYLDEIEDVAFYQTGFGKLIRLGDVRLKGRTKDKKVFYKIFKFMLKPHEFIVHLQELLDSKKASMSPDNA